MGEGEGKTSISAKIDSAVRCLCDHGTDIHDAVVFPVVS